MYWPRPTAVGPLHSATILRNNSQYNTYNGLELTARKRMSHRWMMMSSVVFNRQRHYEHNADVDYLDPTNHAPVDHIDGFENGIRNGPVIGKPSGLYVLPWNVGVAANFNAHTSFPFNPYILSPTRQSSLGTVNVVLTDSNSLRYDTLYQLDVHADKMVTFGGSRRIQLSADVFNVFNNNVVRRKRRVKPIDRQQYPHAAGAARGAIGREAELLISRGVGRERNFAGREHEQSRPPFRFTARNRRSDARCAL